ncbi:MAG: XisH family protein [Pyrinomonadaceae bacterium MAG19_C2-C3]|nr:XisH family protein [Pyrinomonadaceae bacterium MAG19_C2-C3]
MPAKDIYHDTVRNALIKDGWTITDDPLRLQVGLHKMFVDLGAEKLIAAERGEEKIAVEIKSFVSRSELRDLEQAIGQYTLYESVMAIKEPQRRLFLAVRRKVYFAIFEAELGKILLRNKRISLVVFDEKTEEILQWIS